MKREKEGRKGMLEVTRAVNNPGKPIQIHNDIFMTQMNSFSEILSGLDWIDLLLRKSNRKDQERERMEFWKIKIEINIPNFLSRMKSKFHFYLTQMVYRYF